MRRPSAVSARQDNSTPGTTVSPVGPGGERRRPSRRSVSWSVMATTSRPAPRRRGDQLRRRVGAVGGVLWVCRSMRIGDHFMGGAVLAADRRQRVGGPVAAYFGYGRRLRGWETMTAPVPCAGGIVHDAAGRLLVILRGHAPSAGTWSVPGGRCLPGEAAPDACVREVREETGLAVVVQRWAGGSSGPRPAGGRT